MKIKYYKDDNILAITLSEGVVDYAEEVNGMVIHYDKKDRPVRMEVLEARKFLEEEGKALPEEIREEYFGVTA